MNPYTKLEFYSKDNDKILPITRMHFALNSQTIKYVWCMNEVGEEIGFKLPEDGRIRRVKSLIQAERTKLKESK